MPALVRHLLRVACAQSPATSDDQSCDRQERDLHAVARRAGHKIIGVFTETASGARYER
jgi:hypothetical protein